MQFGDFTGSRWRFEFLARPVIPKEADIRSTLPPFTFPLCPLSAIACHSYLIHPPKTTQSRICTAPQAVSRHRMRLSLATTCDVRSLEKTTLTASPCTWIPHSNASERRSASVSFGYVVLAGAANYSLVLNISPEKASREAQSKASSPPAGSQSTAADTYVFAARVKVPRPPASSSRWY